ncbi:hypothetical protein C0J52_18001 [Blattella germanica]|nr:hypothetical protein C0J52_18001 [Blattella germanica]
MGSTGLSIAIAVVAAICLELTLPVLCHPEGFVYSDPELHEGATRGKNADIDTHTFSSELDKNPNDFDKIVKHSSPPYYVADVSDTETLNVTGVVEGINGVEVFEPKFDLHKDIIDVLKWFLQNPLLSLVQHSILFSVDRTLDFFSPAIQLFNNGINRFIKDSYNVSLFIKSALIFTFNLILHPEKIAFTTSIAS